MKTNEAGINLIKTLEGCRLTAYKNKGEKYYTIGYGHNGSDVKANDKITSEKATGLLISDLEKFENYVTKYALKKFPGLNENQFSALVSYTYNRGPKGLQELIKNSSNETQLGFNIVVYWGSNKNYENALKERRRKEQKLFYKSWVNASSTSLKPDFPVPRPVLKRGSMGMQVEYLQKFLNIGRETKIAEDGQFGQETYNALYAYQELHGLIKDGKYGPQSYSYIKNVMEG